MGVHRVSPWPMAALSTSPPYQVLPAFSLVSGPATWPLYSGSSSPVNGGNHYATHLLKSVKSSDYSQTVYEYEPQLLDTLDLNPDNVEAVKLGMWKVANDSESSVYRYFRDLSVEVGAKTGTAQVAADVEATAVFVCFAPYDDPQIAMAIVAEKGGSGGELAGAAAQILAYYFNAEQTLEAPSTENALLR